MNFPPSIKELRWGSFTHTLMFFIQNYKELVVDESILKLGVKKFNR